MDWTTFGHNSVKDLLARQLKAQAFAHAYLFAGPKGIGKKMLALEFAEKILGAKRVLSHPDFSLLSDSDELNIEAVRNFIATLSVKPFVGTYKVAVIDGADRLSTESANALLKTLEEPSPSTIIILISEHKHLLPTMVSRCQMLSMNVFPEAELHDFAVVRGLSVDAESIAAAQGSPALLVRCSEDIGLAQQFRQVAATCIDLESKSVAERLAGIKQFAEQEPDELAAMFRRWIALKRDDLRQGKNVTASLTALQCACMDLKTNKNKQLILQHLFRSV
jgi:DNA polymerase III subunit delta'